MAAEGKNILYCMGCLVRFSILAARVKRRYFCPLCGETVDVVHFNAAKHGRTKYKDRRDWTTGEVATLRHLQSKGVMKTEIAGRLGRSYQSVANKARKLVLAEMAASGLSGKEKF